MAALLSTNRQKHQEKDFFEKGGVGVTRADRAILVNWLITIQVELHLLPETLQCTVSLVDRFMACSKQCGLQISEFQLIGITAMLIACKFHEIHKPAISDFLRLTEDSFTRSAMLSMETRVLKTVDFTVQETGSLPVTLLENYFCAAS